MAQPFNQVINRWEAFTSVGQDFLRPISSPADFEATEALLDEITDRMESPDDPRYIVLFRLLAERLRAWEEDHVSMPEVTPQQRLQFLIEQHNLKQSDLSDLVDQSTLSKILRGQREISKNLAKKLATRFGTSTEVFL
jgi:HTH-type transcriptional regulator / antitoxin HigA